MIKPLNVMGAVEGGMRMRDLVDDRKKKSAVQDAYKKGMQVGPDGKVKFDHGMTASALAEGGYGQEAYQAQQQGQDDHLKQMQATVQRAKFGAQILGAARNQQEWDLGLQQLQDNGMPAGKLPAQFTPENQKYLVDQAMTLEDRLNQEWRQKDFNLREREMYARQQAKSDKDKEMNVAQSKQLGLFKMGAEAEKQFRGAVKDKSYDPTSVIAAVGNPEWAPAWMKNNKANVAHSAQSAWVESFLRDASGATIQPSERMSYAKDYFPRPGDSDEVIKNKNALRKQKMENALIASGRDPSDMPNFDAIDNGGESDDLGFGIDKANANQKSKKPGWAE